LSQEVGNDADLLQSVFLKVSHGRLMRGTLTLGTENQKFCSCPEQSAASGIEQHILTRFRSVGGQWRDATQTANGYSRSVLHQCERSRYAPSSVVGEGLLAIVFVVEAMERFRVRGLGVHAVTATAEREFVTAGG
jgi:hypothetical protein